MKNIIKPFITLIFVIATVSACTFPGSVYTVNHDIETMSGVHFYETETKQYSNTLQREYFATNTTKRTMCVSFKFKKVKNVSTWSVTGYVKIAPGATRRVGTVDRRNDYEGSYSYTYHAKRRC